METNAQNHEAEAASAQSSAAQTHEENRTEDTVSRRALMGASVASVMGLALTQMKTASAQSDNSGLTATGLLTKGTMLMLPAAAAARVTVCALKNPGVARLYEYFTAQGMNLIPERAKVCIYLDQATCETGALLIWPTFKAFPAGAASHEAASIIAVGKDGNFGGALASHVLVNHNPFQLQKFTLFEIDPNTGELVQRSASRDQVRSFSTDELAHMLGPVAVTPAAAPLPSMMQSDLPRLAAGVFSELINDSYARPLYPPGAISNLLRDTVLVQKWSETQRLRYSAALRSFPICSSSSSTNACTSTSTSIINL